MAFFTADICDEIWDEAQVLAYGYQHYGAKKKFSGKIATVKLDKENSSLITLLKEPGEGRVAVVDVEGVYWAVVGENLMKLAYENGWSGILVHGYIRDTVYTTQIDVGLMALGTCPRKSPVKTIGEMGGSLHFGGVTFVPEQMLYADEDGVIVVDAV